MDNDLHVGKLKAVIASAAIILLVSVLGFSFGGGSSSVNMQTARATEQDQASGTINGDGTSVLKYLE